MSNKKNCLTYTLFSIFFYKFIEIFKINWTILQNVFWILFRKYSRHIHHRHVYVVLIIVTPRTPPIDDWIIFQNVFGFFWHEDFRDDLEAFLDAKSLSNVSICKRKNKLNYCPKILGWVRSHLAEALLSHFLSVTILTSSQQRIRVSGFF